MAKNDWTILSDDGLGMFFDKVRGQLKEVRNRGGKPVVEKELVELLGRIRDEIEEREVKALKD